MWRCLISFCVVMVHRSLYMRLACECPFQMKKVLYARSCVKMPNTVSTVSSLCMPDLRWCFLQGYAISDPFPVVVCRMMLTEWMYA